MIPRPPPSSFVVRPSPRPSECRDGRPLSPPQLRAWWVRAQARGLSLVLDEGGGLVASWARPEGYDWRDVGVVRLHLPQLRELLGAPAVVGFDISRPLSWVPIAICDLETTGPNSERDRVCEVSVCRLDRDGAETWTTHLVNPGCPILNSGIHGITDKMVRSAPLFVDLVDELLAALEDCVFLSHSGNRFDERFLAAEFSRAGVTWAPPARLSTLTLAKKLLPQQPSYALQNLASALDLDRGAAHRAEGDVRTTLALWRALKGEAEKRPKPPRTIEQWSKL